jgi:hypothetical protein
MLKRKSTNGQKKRSTKHTYKTKDRVTRTQLKTRGDHWTPSYQEGFLDAIYRRRPSYFPVCLELDLDVQRQASRLFKLNDLQG